MNDSSLLDGLGSIREYLTSKLSAKEITLKTSGGEEVNGVHFEGSIKKAIIYLHGNGCFYETSAQKPLGLIESFKKYGHYPHLLLFNPQGTGKSKGIPHPSNVAKAFLAAFEYLVYKHAINPDEIVIIGHSMGGFFGALGAEEIQKQFPQNQIHFISDRSFADIHSRVQGATLEHKLITSMKWDQDPLAALEKLKGRVCIIYHPQDQVVPYETSLFFALSARPQTLNYSTLKLEDKPPSNAHNREFNDEEHAQIFAELRKMLRLS